MTHLLTGDIRDCIIQHGIPHLESNGQAVLVIPSSLKLAGPHEYSAILLFMKEFRELVGINSNME